MFDPDDRRSNGVISLTDRRTEATRKAVIEAAWELSRDRGLTGWTQRELAGSVGLKAPTLYSYFASKQAIYDEMFREGYEQAHELARSWDALADHLPARVAFKRAMHGFFEFCTADPIRYQLMFQRVVPGFEPSEAAYSVSLRHYERFRSQMAHFGVTGDAEADLWSAISTGLVDQQLSNDPGGDRWERLVDTAVDLFCDHVGIPAEPDGPPAGATPVGHD